MSGTAFKTIISVVIFLCGLNSVSSFGSGLIKLVPYHNLEQVTDMVFINRNEALISSKDGGLWLLKNNGRNKLPVAKLPVEQRSEMGLLAIAIAPDFATSQKIYLYYSPRTRPYRTRLSEWRLIRNGESDIHLSQERILLEIQQPYANHNGGGMRFGPDGYLYLGSGDGGYAGDPHDYAQSKNTLLGKIIRINTQAVGDKPYSIPSDNPFFNDHNSRPEIYAYGLRNPWRIHFSTKGQLIVADVGQNAWEEINLVEAGGNYGWRKMEANQCYNPELECYAASLQPPWHAYPHQRDGASITGGVIYTGKSIPTLTGKYLYADFVLGEIWSIDMKTAKPVYLGKWKSHFSTFARDPEGEVYIAGFYSGIYKIIASE